MANLLDLKLDQYKTSILLCLSPFSSQTTIRQKENIANYILAWFIIMYRAT